MKQIIVLATTNQGKTREINELLKGSPVEIKNLNDFGITRDMIPSLVDAVRPSFSSAPVDFNEKDAIKLFKSFIL